VLAALLGIINHQTRTYGIRTHAEMKALYEQTVAHLANDGPQAWVEELQRLHSFHAHKVELSPALFFVSSFHSEFVLHFWNH